MQRITHHSPLTIHYSQFTIHNQLITHSTNLQHISAPITLISKDQFVSLFRVC